MLEVARDPPARLLTERHDALLASLAADVDQLLLEVDVTDVEADRFRAAESGRVDELDEGPVAECERFRAVELGERGVDLDRIWRIRQPPRPSRRQGDV